MTTARERANALMVRSGDLLTRAMARLEAFRLERKPPAPTVHPARASIHETRTVGDRVADGMAGGVGSWRFVIGQSIFILVWIVLNTVAFIQHWDPYPWILLNLCMSTQAMYTGPILLLANNRQAAKDRARDDLEAHEVEQSTAILAELRELTRELHSHTTCVGHTTIGEPVTAQTATRKAKVKA